MAPRAGITNYAAVVNAPGGPLRLDGSQSVLVLYEDPLVALVVPVPNTTALVPTLAAPVWLPRSAVSLR